MDLHTQSTPSQSSVIGEGSALHFLKVEQERMKENHPRPLPGWPHTFTSDSEAEDWPMEQKGAGATLMRHCSVVSSVSWSAFIKPCHVPILQIHIRTITYPFIPVYHIVIILHLSEFHATIMTILSLIQTGMKQFFGFLLNGTYFILGAQRLPKHAPST